MDENTSILLAFSEMIASDGKVGQVPAATIRDLMKCVTLTDRELAAALARVERLEAAITAWATAAHSHDIVTTIPASECPACNAEAAMLAALEVQP